MSTAYLLLLGLFFVLVDFANSLNFVDSSTQISDLAPVIAQVQEIKTPENVAMPSFNDVATTYTAKQTLATSSFLTIAGKKIAIYNSVNGTNDDAGSRIAKYNNFYYGHNSANVLGSLSSLPIGATFSITENGQTKKYQIAKSETFEKIGANKLATLDNPSRDYSNAIYSASYKGKKYDIALMTCAGVSLGNGDATERYVVFAYEV